MQNSPEFVSYLMDLLAPFGNTKVKGEIAVYRPVQSDDGGNKATT